LLLPKKSITVLKEEFVMNTIQQTVTIPSNRRLQLELPLPDSIPVGEAEMLVVLSPVQEEKPLKSIRHLAGCFADSATFAGDPVALQKAMRDEW
jgi:hypothetical protein